MSHGRGYVIESLFDGSELRILTVPRLSAFHGRVVISWSSAVGDYESFLEVLVVDFLTASWVVAKLRS